MNKTKNFIITFCLLVLAIAFIFPNYNVAQALSKTTFENIELTNGDFNSSPSTSTLDSNPTGWSLIKTTSTVKSGIINVNDSKFKSNYSSYFLYADENPEKMNVDYDDKVLMINARTSSTGSELPSVQGYKSQSIELKPYSFYTFSIHTKTMNNAKASIYLTGLDESIQNVSFESYEATEWTEYEFFLSTGTNEETVNIELWLGKKENTTSSGVVFFDNVTVERHTQANYQTNLKNASLSTESNSYVYSEANIEINYVENINSTLTYKDANLDFEKGTLTNWEITNNEFPENAIADVFNTNQNFELGTDNTANNNYALMLSTENAGFFGYKSPKIEMPMHAIYKISVNAKVDNLTGSAYIILKENNDVNEFYDSENPYTDYTPIEKEIVITTNETDEFKNNYTTYSFYIYGNSLYPTSFNLELWLGQSDDLTKGTVVFDTIRIESISAEDYNNASSSTSNNKIELTSFESELTFTNGTFNNLNNQSQNLEYPIHASDWTADISEENSSVWGIINTYYKLYDQIKDEYLGGRANPENPKYQGINIPTTDTNNILMMWNKGESYQSLISPSFTVSADSYYKLTFNFKTISDNIDDENILNVYVLADDDTILYEKLGINSNNVADKNWSTFEIIFRTSQASKNLKVKLELGTENNTVSGIAYFDNFELNSVEYTNEEYESLVYNANIVDFTNAGFNLKASTEEYGVYAPLTYTGTLENGSNQSSGDPIAFGGIVDSENNLLSVVPNENNTSIIKNVMYLKTNGIATYSMKANDSISLTQGSYYKFTVYVKTNLPENNSDDNKYGAEFSLEGIDGAIIDEITNNVYTQYTIYVKALKDLDVNVRFAISSDSISNTGSAVFDSFAYETVSEEIYNAEKQNPIGTALFVETEQDDDTTDNDNTETPSNNNAMIWYLIPSILFAIALILALVAYAMKKVKIKKPDSKKKGNYDREQTLYRDAIKKEAEDRRDAYIKELKQSLKEIEEEIQTLENENKERIANQRKEHGKNITKEDEKAFKLYANKHTKLLNRLDSIKIEIENANSPEFLIKEIKKIKQGK